MIELRGDKEGFSGQYSADGMTWKVTKFYCGRGVGARWQVKGPYFGETLHNWASIKGIIENWTEQGVSKKA